MRAFDYDDENQLIRVTVTNAWKSEFSYDGKMRRRIRKEFTWRSGAWALTNEVHYIYDGNLVIQERDQNNFPVVAYTRGRDLSGSLEGAGGIGGSLARTDLAALIGQPSIAHAYYHADGSGNVTALLNSSQVVVARYLYDRYGNTLSISGPLAEVNLYCFSSKESHVNSGMYYYGYRWYNPNCQRWLNSDPVGDSGFGAVPSTGAGASQPGDVRNLYSLGGNNPISEADAAELETLSQFRKRCQTISKLDCDRKGRFVAEQGVFLEDSGFTSDGYQLLKYDVWVCRWKCGECTKAEKDRRQAAKNRACNRPRSCQTITDCAEILRRIYANNECGKARASVIECYDAPDAAHLAERAVSRDAERNVLRNFSSCIARRLVTS